MDRLHLGCIYWTSVWSDQGAQSPAMGESQRPETTSVACLLYPRHGQVKGEHLSGVDLLGLVQVTRLHTEHCLILLIPKV